MATDTVPPSLQRRAICGCWSSRPLPTGSPASSRSSLRAPGARCARQTLTMPPPPSRAASSASEPAPSPPTLTFSRSLSIQMPWTQRWRSRTWGVRVERRRCWSVRDGTRCGGRRAGSVKACGRARCGSRVSQRRSQVLAFSGRSVSHHIMTSHLSGLHELCCCSSKLFAYHDASVVKFLPALKPAICITAANRSRSFQFPWISIRPYHAVEQHLARRRGPSHCEVHRGEVAQLRCHRHSYRPGNPVHNALEPETTLCITCQGTACCVHSVHVYVRGQYCCDRISYPVCGLRRYLPHQLSTATQPTRMHAYVQQFTAARAGVEGELRLRALDGSTVLPPGADSGIPEIFHAGAWGTFCRSGRFGPPGDYDPDFPLQPDPVRPRAPPSP